MKKIINRRSHLATSGNLRAATELLAAAMKERGNKFRLMTSKFGTLSEIILEIEFDSMAELAASEAAIDASRENAAAENNAFWPKWSALTQPGGKNEILVLEAEG